MKDFVRDSIKQVVGSMIIFAFGFLLFAIAGRLKLIEGNWLYEVSAIWYGIIIGGILIACVSILSSKINPSDDGEIYIKAWFGTMLVSYMLSGIMWEENPELEQRADIYLASVFSNQQYVSNLINLTELSSQQQQLWKSSLDDDLDKVRGVIRAGVNPNFAYDGASPLINAIEYGHYDIVEFLLFNGADVNKSADGLYPLDKVIDFELHRNEYDEFELLNLLVKAGIDLNVDRGDGQSYLLICIDYNKDNSLRLAEALINAGADVNLQDDYGMTALMYAAKLDATSILNELLDADADSNIKDNNGKTAYSHALDASNMEASKIIRAGKVVHEIRLLRRSDFEN